MSTVKLQEYRTAHEELVAAIVEDYVNDETFGYVFDPETGERVLPLPMPFEGAFPEDDSCNFADVFPDTETADEFGERMLLLYP